MRIIQKRDTGRFYALKYINKEKCISQRAVDNVIRERKLLESLSFYPFLVNLQFAFQDDVNLFMVLDLMLGGDLRYHLDRNSELPEDQIRFWMAEVALGIEYLHVKGVIHRDMKPDNLLLDTNGHIHITDFNITTFIPPKGKYLKSISGTMSYMGKTS